MRRHSKRYLRRYKKGFFERISLTNLLIYLNVIVFLLVLLLIVILSVNLTSVDAFGGSFLQYLALNPQLFVQGYIWTLITSMFMHGSFTHLFVNMVSMFFIGNLVEKIIGRKRFLWFYLISGIAAGLFFVGLAYLGLYVPGGERLFGSIDAFAVGASGALFGIGGLLAVLLPKLRVLVFFIIPMPLWAGMVFLMFGLWIVSALGNWPIGNTAHFGGLVVGVIYGFYLRNKYSRKVKLLNRMFR
ncbi:hypothetical protein COU62_00190 [Candidatus Pacearchaeota archaeon CG10_big_fil_rev_8_21_14_0_10_35_219]|nr:rhomboid family intramembrane serine protease [Candidatus Pacearchaeota archaeon]OIO41832.1 MAG: hypothetical protein AUJ63_04720 [Candidatus Pacearchaeota archaeon CG1_02_35_32]PIO08494.1 MAG: hypothetical protein COU62_00190 [Candidatus Pacearchaeota archaeon CG10_big_fil_rev_8_21_14_0_10_35_219]PIY81797.1 MAG: hypothetical protein COY79_00650 [Candidatus Pacearchaeota archaeon CG_4_10_14_0_8_um_filter_35_169]PIZ80086.1 MAG: hypothetical protein COY00_02345 [Candidatus Pacearchaeota archae